MIITFLGTGTSQGVPIIGCDCAVCCSDDPRNRRSRTSAIIQVNGLNLLIDAGPDFRVQALTHQLTRLDALLLTHHHFDHIAGIDDLRPLTERHGTMRIYGRSDTLAHVRKVFSYAFSQESRGSSRPSLELVTIDGMFQLEGVAIQPIEVLHGTMPINSYRIGNLAYVTDASAIPPHSLEMLRGVEVLVINALRYEPHPTHFSLEESLAIIADIRPERAYLVHLTHAFEHATVQEQLPNGVMLAYDGLPVALGDPS